jgi:hypothetical protein
MPLLPISKRKKTLVMETIVISKIQSLRLLAIVFASTSLAEPANARIDDEHLELNKPAAAPNDGNTGVLSELVTKATNRFRDLNAAIAEGYLPVSCLKRVDGSILGIRFANRRYLNDGDSLDIGEPEAILYSLASDGRLAPIAVEYIAFTDEAEIAGVELRPMKASHPYGPKPHVELLVGLKPSAHSLLGSDQATTHSCIETAW